VKLFAKRLGIIALTVAGLSAYFGVANYVMNWSWHIHLSESFRTVIAWIGLIVIAGCLIYLIVMILIGIWVGIKWLFIEPFRKGARK
jgi:hypothetical protein